MGIENNFGLFIFALAIGALFGAVAMDVYLLITQANKKDFNHE